MERQGRVILASFFIALLFCLSGCGDRKSQIRLGYLPIAECTPLFIAASEGFFAKHGLDVTLTEFDAGPTVIAATLGGSLDGGLAGVAPIFFAAAKGKRIKMVADGGHVVPSEHPYIGLVVAADSQLMSIKQLEGKTVGVNGLKTIEDALLRVALNKSKMSNSVNVVEFPHPLIVQALAKGTLDAAVAIEPYISMGLADNKIRILMTSEEILPDFQLSAIFFSYSFISARPDDLKRFILSYNVAIDFISKNPQRAKEIVSQWTKTPKQTALNMTLPGWSKQLPVSGIKRAEEAMIQNNILESPVNIEEYIFNVNAN
jgi:NitT/TauT family transport system substrate-binding protein